MKRWFLLILIAFFSIECGSPKPIEPESIDRIEFFAMCKGIEYSHGIHSFSELKEQARDTVVYDSVFIHRFIQEINLLVPQRRSYSVDFRSCAILHRTKGSPITILFGENFGVEYDGKMMEDRKALFEMINEEIYATQSYEYWYPDEESRRMYRVINGLD